MSAAAAAGRTRSAGRAICDALSPPPHLRRRLIGLTLLVTLLSCGYLFWLRDSSFVKVETVTVTGVTSDDAGRVRAALAAAAREMTTLHVDRGRLEEATAAFPVVRSIDVRPDFPSAMRIHVVEHRPAAVLASGSKRVPVAADGSVLSGLPVRGKLPRVRFRGALPERRMAAGDALSAVRVAAGLPAALRGRVGEVRRDGGKGLIAPIANGPRLIFGSASQLGAKWAAAIRVLADTDAAGADYIDVRVPERPVAGGLPVATVAPAPPAQESPPAAPPAGPPVAADGAGTPAPAAGPGPGAASPDPQTAPPEAPAAAAPQERPPPPRAGEGGGAAPYPQP
jgi:cell division septal protein FtsQ